MSNFSWRWRTKPRSAIRVVQWFPEFEKLEGKNWNEELLEKFSTYEKNKIHPIRRIYTYNAHVKDKENNFLSEEQFLSGQFDTNEVEGDARNDKSTYEDLGFGYVDNDGFIKVTKVGKNIAENKFDSEDFLKQLLKIEYPNFTFKPNEIGKWQVFPMEIVLEVFKNFDSINRHELVLFFGCTRRSEIPLLINSIKLFKKEYEKLPNKLKDAENLCEKIFIKTFGKLPNKLGSFYDYADAFSRALVYTGLFSTHGRSRATKLRIAEYAKAKFKLLAEKYIFIEKKFLNLDEYMNWFGNPDSIHLPWEDINSRKELIKDKVRILKDIESGKNPIIKKSAFARNQINQNIKVIEKTLSSNSESEIKKLENQIVVSLTKLNEENFINEIAYTKEARSEILERFELILKDDDMSALWLEVNTWKSLLAIHGEKKVKRNFNIEEDLTPKSFAPGIGNTPDMELSSENYIILPEVSLMTGIRQWEHEGSSVIDHVLKFINDNDDKIVLGLFISSSINIRTKWQFFILNKESWMKKPVPVIPMTIKMYSEILEYIYKNELTISDFISLLFQIHTLSLRSNNFNVWYDATTDVINNWRKSVVT